MQKQAKRHVQSASPATKNDDGHVQRAAAGRKTAPHLLTRSQEYCACHAKQLSIVSRTRLNVRKYHACHAKRNNDTSETAKKDHLCKTSHRHGRIVLAQTIANGSDRQRNVERTYPPPPDPIVKREPLLSIRKKFKPAYCRDLAA